ncbi:unnamed protein product, partial [Staurois parvus]
MICVAPAVPISCQCSSMPPASAHQCHISVPTVHINATFQCPSELPFSANYQCQSVPPINASQCCQSVSPQCQSVPPNSASQCRLSVPYMSAAFQCTSVM